ncbi:MAG: sensor histidine kinase [Chitinophagales bacterium]|nr:sensor histidine kinase [Chitinophagales bacterium]
MSNFDKIIDNRLIQNIAIWIILYLIIAISFTAPNSWLAGLFVIALLAPPIYVNNFYILPHFQKNKPKFFFLFLLNALFFTSISIFLIGIVLESSQEKMFLNFLGILFLSLAFGATLKITRDSFIRRQQDKEAELKLLKAQLNPHFLFNTLNNLYGLSVIKSDKLPNLMLKLSELLRYSLYETKELLVPLEKEIHYLENYISLEKIRLEDTEIDFNVNGVVNDKLIAPMLLIVFVENAFKHLGGKHKVAIEIESANDKVYFKCQNSFDDIKQIDKELEDSKGGIGLANAKKRLALLYPNKHHLIIKKEELYFSVNLEIEL